DLNAKAGGLRADLRDLGRFGAYCFGRDRGRLGFWRCDCRGRGRFRRGAGGRRGNRLRMVFGGGGHHRALSSGGGCAAGCGGESAEGGDRIGYLVGQTGKDGRLAAEDGGLGAQRLKRVEAPSATVGDGFGEELT